ncbi:MULTISPECIES: hypothetical protein [Citrobacter]|uniref:Fimbrial protein n=1 Tax=Citrobacter telavivensis TaxID=2653932 RepID=A0A6L5E2U6_9ENTR|nr:MULTISPECIES: hypothetical protein [Citrobacter]MPQ49832.1 hypothetical protein [Citrobacter telavivensis]QFS70576.1 hypothetical protein GBC03_10310 [Citrobacter telavivensis]CAI9387179.1 hypothetical protein CITSP_00021 [Citrobacter sp. T1.2D-1]
MTKRICKYIMPILVLSGISQQASADIVPAQPFYWNNNTTLQRANCSVSFSGQQPLSQSRTLIVDDNIANGATLYSWDYGDFIPNITFRCNSGAGGPYYLDGQPYQISSFGFTNSISGGFGFRYGTFNSTTQTFSTTNPGIGMKLYVKLVSSGSTPIGYTPASTGYSSSSAFNYVVTTTAPASTGVEYPVTSVLGENAITTFFEPIYNAASKQFTFSGSDHFATYAVRGELIKINDVQASPNLSLSSGFDFFTKYGVWGVNYITTNSGVPTSIIGSGGITVIKPTCRLRGATNYQVNLGTWTDVAGRNTGVLPAYGAIKPIDLNIECSGKVNNVKFSFQDAGSDGLLNRNITVYDSGGQFIEGLEIEMSYNGSRIDVNTTIAPYPSFPVSTGSKGQVKTNTQDLSYSSQDTAQFGARFVQRGAIKRNGASYTGPVTGQVNMTVTYE